MKSHYNPELRYPQSPYGQGYLYPMTKHIHTVGFGRGSVASVEARTDTAAQPGLAGQSSAAKPSLRDKLVSALCKLPSLAGKTARALVDLIGIVLFPLLVAISVLSILPSL